MNKPSPETQKIVRPNAAEAADALGGVPTRPPVPRAFNPDTPDQAAARAAFTASHTTAAVEPLPTGGGVLASQPIVRPGVMPAAPEPLGHPIFDPVPDAVGQLREKVSVVRLRLGALARLILAENAELQPIIAELEERSQDVLLGEQFSAAVAREFLEMLRETVDGLRSDSSVEAPAAEVAPAEDPAEN